jgi:hypothetical protein
MAAVAAATCLAGGCGGGDEPAPPPGPLADALAATGGGGANGSLGFGWAEPQLAAERGLPDDVIAAALAPNAGSVVVADRTLKRRFGLAPLDSTRLTSVAGSYAFGLRLDGVDGDGLAEALEETGARSRSQGDVELVDAASYASVPQPLLDSGVRGLGAFDALGDDVVVLAISETARATLLGEGDRLLDEPTYAAAARCLGDVAAVRMVPDRQLISTEQGVDLVAAGVRNAGDEVLCVLGGTAERADEIASNLESSLAADSPDPISRAPVGDSVESADVGRDADDGVEVVEADITLAAGEEPGYLLRAIPQGALVGLINDSGRSFTRTPDSQALARGED